MPREEVIRRLRALGQPATLFGEVTAHTHTHTETRTQTHKGRGAHMQRRTQHSMQAHAPCAHVHRYAHRQRQQATKLTERTVYTRFANRRRITTGYVGYSRLRRRFM